ncbi:MAG: methyltransferase domain-containing protein [Actinophytocola sp.]|nr:methyltransferase domain-containing protein [Actinophytocola sp.]
MRRKVTHMRTNLKDAVRRLVHLAGRGNGPGSAGATGTDAGSMSAARIHEIKDIVSQRYGDFAASGGVAEACCAAVAEESETGFAVEHGLYSAEEMALVPEGAANLSRGCGNPVGFARLEPGETVVDFGCGGGIDVILAAHKVGPTGKVVGADSAPAMIERARDNTTTAGVGDRVEFRSGDLADTALPTGFADAVISNCVINLCPDKEQVYREAFRLLRPGGRMAISDICLTEELPTELTASFVSMWSGCLGGAIPTSTYFEIVEGAGFTDVSVVTGCASLMWPRLER